MTDWQPGDPLHARPTNHQRHAPIACYKDDHFVPIEQSPDRAEWPEPAPGRGLSEKHDLLDFIAEHHARREAP